MRRLIRKGRRRRQLADANGRDHLSAPGRSPVLSRNEAILISDVPQTSLILASLGQAAFVWDIATDVIVWNGHAGAVFPNIPLAQLSRGADFAKLIEPEQSVRSDVLLQSPPVHGEDGTPYRIEYGVRISSAAALIWIEETGRWFAGADGRPSRVQGIVRINNERHARDEHLLQLAQHDPLTGALNRTPLIAALEEALDEAHRFLGLASPMRRLSRCCRGSRASPAGPRSCRPGRGRPRAG